MTYEFHPLAELFPLIEGDEFEQLTEDISANGLREPIWLYEGKILDGRNRARACELSGIEPEYREYAGEHPTAFVVSLNLKRRHLSTSQRSIIAARLANLRHGQKTSDTANAVTQSVAAQTLNVSTDSLQRASKVLDEGIEEVVDAVMEGVLSTAAAATIVKEPPEKQRALVNVSKDEQRDAVRMLRNYRNPPKTSPEEQDILDKQDVLMAFEKIADPPISATRMASVMIEVQRADVMAML